MGFSGTAHKVIVTIAQVLSGVGALMIVSENDVLGISDQAAAWVIFAANVLTVVATSIRGNWIPGVTTGVGTES